MPSQKSWNLHEAQMWMLTTDVKLSPKSTRECTHLHLHAPTYTLALPGFVRQEGGLEASSYKYKTYRSGTSEKKVGCYLFSLLPHQHEQSRNLQVLGSLTETILYMFPSSPRYKTMVLFDTCAFWPPIDGERCS